MPFGEGQRIPHEELDRLRGLIDPPGTDAGGARDAPAADLAAMAERLAAATKSPAPAPSGRDRSELLDLLASSPEAKAIRAGMHPCRD